MLFRSTTDYSESDKNIISTEKPVTSFKKKEQDKVAIPEEKESENKEKEVPVQEKSKSKISLFGAFPTFRPKKKAVERSTEEISSATKEDSTAKEDDNITKEVTVNISPDETNKDFQEVEVKSNGETTVFHVPSEIDIEEIVSAQTLYKPYSDDETIEDLESQENVMDYENSDDYVDANQNKEDQMSTQDIIAAQIRNKLCTSLADDELKEDQPFSVDNISANHHQEQWKGNDYKNVSSEQEFNQTKDDEMETSKERDDKAAELRNDLCDSLADDELKEDEPFSDDDKKGWDKNPEWSVDDYEDYDYKSPEKHHKPKDSAEVRDKIASELRNNLCDSLADDELKEDEPFSNDDITGDGQYSEKTLDIITEGESKVVQNDDEVFEEKDDISNLTSSQKTISREPAAEKNELKTTDAINREINDFGNLTDSQTSQVKEPLDARAEIDPEDKENNNFDDFANLTDGQINQIKEPAVERAEMDPEDKINDNIDNFANLTDSQTNQIKEPVEERAEINPKDEVDNNFNEVDNLTEDQKNEISEPSSDIAANTLDSEDLDAEPVYTERKAQANRGDIRRLMTLNDRFLFQRELFKGDIGMLNQTLDMINSFDSYQETLAYFDSEFNWKRDDEAVESFLAMIERYFSNKQY